MIHHMSIPANNPRRVADALAEILNGRVFPFPPCPGAFIVLNNDDRGSAIEVLPAGSVHAIGKTEAGCEFVQNPQPAAFGPVHALLSVPCEVDKLRAVAEREGWHLQECSREGFFDLVECWVENHTMLEMACPSHLQRYLDFLNYENLDKAFTEMEQRALAGATH
jgi:hypothetical protein